MMKPAVPFTESTIVQSITSFPLKFSQLTPKDPVEVLSRSPPPLICAFSSAIRDRMAESWASLVAVTGLRAAVAEGGEGD